MSVLIMLSSPKSEEILGVRGFKLVLRCLTKAGGGSLFLLNRDFQLCNQSRDS